MEPISRHVIRKARGAADAAHEHRPLAHEAQFRAGFLHRLQDRVITAPRAPADLLIRRIVLGRKLRVGDRGDGHRFRIACAISVTRNGLPVTFGSDSAGIRYSARSNFTSWPLFISGTSTRSNCLSKSPRLRGKGLKYRT